MTIQEFIKDAAATLGALGTIATVIAHLPFVPAKWAALLARFASYASAQRFDVTRKDPQMPDAVPIHITIPPAARTPNDVPPPAALRSLLLAFFLIGGCSLFGSGRALAPVAGCAPSPDELLNQAALILLQGGDYEQKLKELAGKYTESTVDCAVAELVSEWTKPSAKSDTEHQEAAARGKSHLEQSK